MTLTFSKNPLKTLLSCLFNPLTSSSLFKRHRHAYKFKTNWLRFTCIPNTCYFYHSPYFSHQRRAHQQVCRLTFDAASSCYWSFRKMHIALLQAPDNMMEKSIEIFHIVYLPREDVSPLCRRRATAKRKTSKRRTRW